MNEIVINEPTIIPIKPTGKGLIGFASCTFNNSLSLNSMAIYTRLAGDGIRLVYPDKVLPNGKVINLFYPITREIGELIEKAIFDKYTQIAQLTRIGKC